MTSTPSEIGKNKDYPKYLFNEAGILSGSQFHKRMIDEGYLEPAGCKDYLEQCNATELKEILSEKELKSSGKKDALVERILESISEDEIMSRFKVQKYVLTDMGRDFLEKNEDYVKLHTIAKEWQTGCCQNRIQDNGRSTVAYEGPGQPSVRNR